MRFLINESFIIVVNDILFYTLSARRDRFLERTHAASDSAIILEHKGILMSTSLIPGNTLITASPEEGRQLAMKMARLVIKATQPDDVVREKLRGVYANDAVMLLQAGQVVAAEFATIAAANGYWHA